LTPNPQRSLFSLSLFSLSLLSLSLPVISATKRKTDAPTTKPGKKVKEEKAEKGKKGKKGRGKGKDVVDPNKPKAGLHSC
jgi:hypothetical protein